MLEYAKQYIARGWKLFPLHSIQDGQCTCGTKNCGDAGKHPRVPKGLKEASGDLAKIEEWFGPTAPPSNIAVVTGAASGITVLDIDVGPGKHGAESWAELIREKGEPNTLMARTGSGGMHMVFKYNSSLKTASNVLGPGIDCRNDGGYIVAPPSLHRSGGTYNWEEDAPIADLPAHLAQRKETRGRKRSDAMYAGRYSLQQVQAMLVHVSSADRDLWRSVGIILGREFNRSAEAWDVYWAWAEKDAGKKSRNHDEIMREAFHDLSQQTSESQLTIGTIVKAAIEGGWAPKAGEVPVGNFVFYGPGNNFIYRPTASYWVAGAVDAAVSPVNEGGRIIKASDWLKTNQLVTSMTSDPAYDEDYLKGLDCCNGEMIKQAGAAVFNTYRKPTIELGDARLAQPFLEHVNKVFNKPGDAQQFLSYMAHRVQKPWEKPRFALLIAGGQGVGKDTAIEFCCPAIGSWNVANIDPAAFEASFNEYVACTLVRISEAANLHEMSKWAFNERTKVLIAGLPDVMVVNPKYGQKFTVRMYCGVIITTNHLTSGIYIPPDDRRYDVIEAATMEEMNIDQNYFSDLWEWFHSGGANHVAAYLHSHSLEGFNPANGQRKTEAHKTVVASGMVGDEWLDDVLSWMDYPDLVRADWVVEKASETGEPAPAIRKKVGNAMVRSGYDVLRCSGTKDGRWKLDGKNVTVYSKRGTKSTGKDVLELKPPF